MDNNQTESERIYRFLVKVSEEEQEAIQRAARLNGLSAPAFLRMLGLNYARERLTEKASAESAR